MEDEVIKALKKRATGYETTEITEEYSDDGNGGIKMVKRKVVSKNVPPDVSAVKLLVEASEVEDITKWTDEQLEKEKKRLIKILLSEGNNDDDTKK